MVALVHCQLDYGNCVLVGASSYLVRRLQSVLNASAQLIFNLHRSDHVSGALASLHWFRAPERIRYKLATLVYRVMRGGAPSYLGALCRVADRPGSLSLRSAQTDCLIVPLYRLSTVGSRAFQVAGQRCWNSMPDDVTSARTYSSLLLAASEDISVSCFLSGPCQLAAASDIMLLLYLIL